MQPLIEAKKIQGWMNDTELKWLRKKALEMPRGAVAVALGVWRGRSVVAMDVDHIFIVCIDHFRGSPGDLTEQLADREDIQGAFLHNMGRLGIEPNLIVADAVDSAALVRDDSIHFVFIDCDEADFERLFWAWYPKIAPGGIIAGHDFAPEFPEVQNVIKKSGLYFWLVGGSSIWLIKRYSDEVYRSIRR